MRFRLYLNELIGSETRIFRPSAAAYVRGLGIGGLVLVGIVVFVVAGSLASGHWSGRSLSIVAGVIGVAGGIAAYMINARVEVSDDKVRVRGLSGLSRSWPRAEIQGCATLVVTSGIGTTNPLFLVYGSGHRKLFSLEAGLWDAHTIGELGNALVGEYPQIEILSHKEALQRFPGSLSFTKRHYVLVGASFAVVAIALFTVLALTVFR